MTTFVPKKEAQGFIMPTFIQKNKKISLSAKYLYGVLCDYARHRAFCYPSKKTLSEVMDCSLNSIRNWLKELILHGFVKSVFNGRVDIYYLFFPAGEKQTMTQAIEVQDKQGEQERQEQADQYEQEEQKHTEANTGDKKICGQRSNFAQGGSNFAPKSNLKLKLLNLTPTPFAGKEGQEVSGGVIPSPSQIRKKGGDNFANLNQQFEEVWSIYPKKEAKNSARALWFRLGKKGSLPNQENLKEVLTILQNSYGWLKENGRFIPYFVNFLKGKRWQDVSKNVAQKAVQNETAHVNSKPFMFETHTAITERLKREKMAEQAQTEKNKEVEKAFNMFKTCFEIALSKIDECLAFRLFLPLYEQGKLPFVKEKQGISLLEFLKQEMGKVTAAG